LPGVGATGPSGAEAQAPSGGSPRLRRRGLIALGAVLGLAAAICAAALLAAKSRQRQDQSAGQGFNAALGSVPLNRVRGRGSATLVLRGTRATVTVKAAGLVPDVHLMHLHEGSGRCPGSSDRHHTRPHAFFSGGDGVRVYGSRVLSLTKRGFGTSPSVFQDFNYFDRGPTIRYERAIALGPLLSQRLRLDLNNGNLIIAVHGIDYDRNGKYDAVLGRVPAATVFPSDYALAEATAPALCGRLIRSVGSRSAATERYTATLESPTTAVALLCHLTPAGLGRRRAGL
jgi:hypothetical protein